MFVPILFILTILLHATNQIICFTDCDWKALDNHTGDTNIIKSAVNLTLKGIDIAETVYGVLQKSRNSTQENLDRDFLHKVSKVGKITQHFAVTWEKLIEIRKDGKNWCEGDDCYYRNVDEVVSNIKHTKLCQETISKLRTYLRHLYATREFIYDLSCTSVWYAYLRDEFRCNIPIAIQRCNRLSKLLRKKLENLRYQKWSFYRYNRLAYKTGPEPFQVILY